MGNVIYKYLYDSHGGTNLKHGNMKFLRYEQFVPKKINKTKFMQLMDYVYFKL